MTPMGTGRGRHTPSPDTRPRPHSEVRPSPFGSSRRTDVPRCSDPRVGVGGGGCTADCSEAFCVWNFSKTLPGLMSPARAAAVPSTPQGSRALEVLRPSCLEPPCPRPLQGPGCSLALKESQASLLPLPGYLTVREKLSQKSRLPDTWSVEQGRRERVSPSGRSPNLALFFSI